MAGTLYLSDGPSFSAAIAGTNEFPPGGDIVLPVKLENRGLVNFIFSQSGYMERDDKPNTAKFVTVTLGSGNAPFIVKSDPQMLGDVLGGKTVPVSFNIKIPKDTPSGTYTLPMSVTYQYLASAEQNGQDVIQFLYKNKTVELPITLKVSTNVILSAVPAAGETLDAGTEGYLDLDVTNTGEENASDAVIRIARNGNSPWPRPTAAYMSGISPQGRTRPAVSRFPSPVMPTARPILSTCMPFIKIIMETPSNQASRRSVSPSRGRSASK